MGAGLRTSSKSRASKQSRESFGCLVAMILLPFGILFKILGALLKVLFKKRK